MPIDSTSEENVVVHPSIGTDPIIDSPGFPNDENMVHSVQKKDKPHAKLYYSCIHLLSETEK